MDRKIKYVINPEWEEIERIRNKSKVFFKSNHHSEKAINALIMNIRELLENAIKYGLFRMKKV
jgi:anti-sigma regulatory factor (Ser/Thr protein kinase)